MKKPELYRLEKSETGVIVYRTDHNYGRQGVVFPDSVRKEYTPGTIPQYIIAIARKWLQTDKDVKELSEYLNLNKS